MEAAASETAPEIIAQFVFIVLVAALMFGWSLLFPAKRQQDAWDVRPAE